MILLLACAEPVEDTGCAEIVTWESWGEGFFRTYCEGCHSSTPLDRHGAPDGMDFDTLEGVKSWAGPIRDTVLVDGTMPLGGGVSEDELALLDDFLTCGF